MKAEQAIAKMMPVIHRWDHLGTQRFENGTLLVARTPHRGPEAWLHIAIGPAPDAAIARLDEEFSGKVPTDFRDFLRCANGLILFSRRLSIYGIRTSYDRSPTAPPQPFDLSIPNRQERVPDAPEDAFFIGTYAATGDKLAVLAGSGGVFRCARWNPTPLQTWPSFPEMLLGEVNRYAKLCDNEGRMHPTTIGI